MTTNIPPNTPPSAYERFVVTPLSKVARVAIAVFKFIAAIVTWPFKAIYRLFVPSEPKQKEAASPAPAAAPAAPVRAFDVELGHEGVQDFSTVLKELIESELRARPLAENEEREQVEKDLVRCTKMTTINGSETHEYGREHSQQFLNFLDASSSDQPSLRSLFYFYLAQTSLLQFVQGISKPLMEEKNLFLCMPDDAIRSYKVESSGDELKTENTCKMCLRKLENGVPGEIFKDCILSLKATINKSTHAVEIQATIELKNPVVAPVVNPAPSDTQNSATAKKAKADVYRPVETKFLKNIVDRAVAQLSKGGRLKLFLFILANVKINRRGEDLRRQNLLNT
ncbi:MAG: hypothetical protein KGQ54_04960 [Verrucomicrobia bacterium]|nr:hypothetical protein [Verrucomicrobiota bacterium]